MGMCMCTRTRDCCLTMDGLRGPGEKGRVYRIPGYLRGVSQQPTAFERKRAKWVARRLANKDSRP